MHDADVDTEVNVTFSWQCLYQRVKLMLLGQSDTLPRTANLVQVLGNMTVTYPTLPPCSIHVYL